MAACAGHTGGLEGTSVHRLCSAVAPLDLTYWWNKLSDWLQRFKIIHFILMLQSVSSASCLLSTCFNATVWSESSFFVRASMS